MLQEVLIDEAVEVLLPGAGHLRGMPGARAIRKLLNVLAPMYILSVSNTYNLHRCEDGDTPCVTHRTLPAVRMAYIQTVSGTYLMPRGHIQRREPPWRLSSLKKY